MATQGLVTVTENGKVIIKAVCGCNGYNAEKLADAIRKENIRSRNGVYDAAIVADFGCDCCLVVMDKDGYEAADIDELHPRYGDTFDKPRFNPRWERGTAANTVIVELAEAIKKGVIGG